MRTSGKSVVPPAEPRWIQRPRLIEALQWRWRYRVVSLVAGAGFGKSALIAQAVAENDIALAGTDIYLGCTPELHEGPSLADQLGPGLGARGFDRGSTFDGLGSEPVCLICDDVHNIEPGSSDEALLVQLIEQSPPNVHLVLAGRSCPPDLYDRARLHIGEGELAFTEAERARLAATKGVGVEESDGVAGWPALVDLCTSIGRDAGLDRIRAQVRAERTVDEIAALFSLAVVGDTNAEELLVLGLSEAEVEPLLADLPLAERVPSGWHVHTVWSQLAGLAMSDDEHLVARRRAARVLAARGEVRRAIDDLIAAADWDAVGGHIVAACEIGHPPVERRVLAGWLQALPDSLASGAIGELLRAATWQRSDPQKATKAARDAARMFRAHGNVAGELAGLFQLGFLAWLTGGAEDLAQILQRALELEAEGDSRAAVIATIGRAALADLVRDHERALSELDRLDDVELGPELPALVGWLRSSSLLLLGDVDQALAAAEAALEGNDPADPFWVPVEGALLYALWFSGRFDEALEGIPRVVERSMDSVTTHLATVACAQAAYVYALAGDAPTAAAHIALAQSRTEPGSDLVAAHLALGEAAVAIADGDEERARTAMRANIEKEGGVGHGVGADVRLRLLALTYVTLPETRGYWDAAHLPKVFATARQLARTVVEVRETGTLSPGGLPSPPVVRTHLFARWAIEVAVAGSGRDRTADDLLDALWPNARPVVRRLSTDASPLSDRARELLATRPAPPPEPLRIDVLGPLAVFLGERSVNHPDLDRERVRHLLLYLISHSPCPRSQVASALWPNQAPDAALANLRFTLHHVLRLIEPERREGEASFIIRGQREEMALAPSPWLEVDAERFRRLVEEAGIAASTGDVLTARQIYETALQLWRGEYLEDATYEDWAISAQREFRERYVSAALSAGTLALANDESRAAAELCMQILATDAYDVAAHELRISAHVQAGDLSAAAGATQMYAAALGDLDLDPVVAAEFLASLNG